MPSAPRRRISSRSSSTTTPPGWTDDNAYTTRADAQRFENWERYFAGVIGLKVATDQANELGMEPIWARLRALADGLRAPARDR